MHKKKRKRKKFRQIQTLTQIKTQWKKKKKKGKPFDISKSGTIQQWKGRTLGNQHNLTVSIIKKVGALKKEKKKENNKK